jgi:hypothetical protein
LFDERLPSVRRARLLTVDPNGMTLTGRKCLRTPFQEFYYRCIHSKIK